MNKKIKNVIEDVKRGIPIVLVDEYSREFEGDIVIAAEKATKHNLIFAMRHAKGLMCLPCTNDKLEQFKIQMMYSNKNDKFGTPFTTSIDAIEGTTTGMSVEDRLKTISTFINDSSKPKDLSQPGHLFPLRARPGLLKERRGHTEGSIELIKMAGLKPLTVIIEIMDENGLMIKGSYLEDFAKIYNLQLISIEEIYDAVYNQSL